MTQPTGPGRSTRVVDGRLELFVPPVWVCGEPDDSAPWGMCGMPVESEPCEVHHPDAMDAYEREEQERDEAVAPVPDETAAAEAWTTPEHTGTVIHMVGDRYAWTCRRGSGRNSPASTDWETAAGELREHERAAYPLHVAVPEAEYRAILNVVAAARAWRERMSELDSAMGVPVIYGAASIALIDAVDALPPQAPPEAYEPVGDQLRFRGMFRDGEDKIEVGHGVGCVAVSIVGQGVQTATTLDAGEAAGLGRALVRQSEAAAGLAQGGPIPASDRLRVEPDPHEVVVPFEGLRTFVERQQTAIRGRRRAKSTDETRCHRCEGPNVPWSAPSPLWNQVMRGGSINGVEIYDGIVCPTCFAQLAEAAGVADLWSLSARRVHVELETVTPSGRVWDEVTGMWRDSGSAPEVWRTGSHLGRTLYIQQGPEGSKADLFVGIMDTPELARTVVDAVNACGGRMA